MSVRDGRGPRGVRPPVPVDRDSFADAGLQERDARRGVASPDPRRGRVRGGRAGAGVRLGGLVRFLVFAAVLAVVVLVSLLTVLRPVARLAVVGWAYDNARALQLPFVADLVREDLGTGLTTPAGSDPAVVEFDVLPGDTPIAIAARLKAAHMIRDDRAFLFVAVQRDLAARLKDGTFLLRATMTPDQVVAGLVDNRLVIKTVTVTFREGLRIEQMAAKLQTFFSGVDAKTFYDIALHPPADLVAAYPWMGLPEGHSLEGFLYPATYTLVIDGGTRRPLTTALDLVKAMLDKFYSVAANLVSVPAERKLSFYQIITLAAIVEQEAVLDVERPLIAGVYQNRLNPKLFPLGMLQSDPTVIYLNDTVKLRATPFEQWPGYLFWGADKVTPPATAPADLAGYNTYASKGLTTGPICSPQLASINAALTPTTDTGYLYFIAKGDGTNTTAFAKTYAEHLVNVKKYLK